MNRILILVLLLGLFGCKTPEARKPITHSSGSFIKESAERNKKLNEAEQDRIKNLMEATPDIDFITSQNGFWYYYKVKVEGDSIRPQFGDIVNFDYNIKDLNGTTIYTFDELKTQHYAMDQEELFSGLREGLKLMKAGETAIFLFPSQKAFGYYGDENRIGTNIPLMCEVRVNAITKTKIKPINKLYIKTN